MLTRDLFAIANLPAVVDLVVNDMSPYFLSVWVGSLKMCIISDQKKILTHFSDKPFL